MDDGSGLEFVFGGRRRVFCCHMAGLTRNFPSNSLPAVEECVAAGVPRLEIDVRFLADDSMLIFHDGDLANETTGVGRADALDGAAARALRYRSHPDVGICFLDEVVNAMRGSKTLLQVDLKLMRPISAKRAALLAEALRPIEEHVLIGTQAHWNLRPLQALGYRIALDPTLHWHYAPGRPMELTPRQLGVHGLWDDSPLAQIPYASAQEYVANRISDLVNMVPGVVEWMVDTDTVQHLAALGCALGDALAAYGIELAAWTLRDQGALETGALLRSMLELGATTVIADDPTVIAGYLPPAGSVNAP